jgi:hypothetical protein
VRLGHVQQPPQLGQVAAVGGLRQRCGQRGPVEQDRDSLSDPPAGGADLDDGAVRVARSSRSAPSVSATRRNRRSGCAGAGLAFQHEQRVGERLLGRSLARCVEVGVGQLRAQRTGPPAQQPRHVRQVVRHRERFATLGHAQAVTLQRQLDQHRRSGRLRRLPALDRGFVVAWRGLW